MREERVLIRIRDYSRSVPPCLSVKSVGGTLSEDQYDLIVREMAQAVANLLGKEVAVEHPPKGTIFAPEAQ